MIIKNKSTLLMLSTVTSISIAACTSDVEQATMPSTQVLVDDVRERDTVNEELFTAVDKAATNIRRVEAERQAGTSEQRRLRAPAMESIASNLSTTSDAPAVHSLIKQQGNIAPDMRPAVSAPNTEKYQEQVANRVIRTADQSTSTFSIDVDTGAYANVRRFLQGGTLPPEDAVRVEELLNYFDYNYVAPDSTDAPFSITAELGTSPWNNNTRLLHIGLKGYEIAEKDRLPANLVFLIDVSGSMNSPDKLGLLKSSLKLLSRQMSSNDTVSIVVYAGASGIVLEPTAGDQHAEITRALSQLSAGGSTNGQAGIELAYHLASENFKEEGVNRVILATDGDFNVGISDIDELKNVIERNRESGIALTTLGFGTGNYNDHLMEQLADVGNGSYAYIDTLSEARKVLVEELTATLLTIAKDVKIQVEFNPSVVSEYRLIGYVNRHLANEDFSNDNVDAGEIGAGHTVTALYELALHGDDGERHSTSRYQQTPALDDLSNEVADVRLRYKQPGGNKSILVNHIVSTDSTIAELEKMSENYRFSAAVAAFGQLLRGSHYMEDFTMEKVAQLAASAKGEDRFGYRGEFVKLVDLARSLEWPSHSRNNSDDDGGSRG